MKVLRFSVLLLLSACAADPVTEVTISPLDVGVVSEAGDYTGDLRVTNVGKNPATLQRIEQRGGAGGIFVITPDIELEPGESTVWRVRLQVREPGLKQVDLAAVFDGSETLFPVRAFFGEPCAPVSIDVGESLVGRSVSFGLEVKNPFGYPAEIDLGTAPALFSVEPAGKVRLAANETRSVAVTFTPTADGLTEVPWRFASRTDCLASTSTLRGRGITRALVFSPGRVNVGMLAPPSIRDIPVQLRNDSQRGIRVVSASLPDSVVTLESAFPFEVPAGGSVSLMLRVRPVPSGDEFFAELVLTTDSPLFPTVALPVLINRTGSCVSGSRASVSFPTTENLCRSERERIELTNGCPHPVTLANVAAPEGFALVVSRPGLTLAPGARTPLEFVFAPRTAGDRSAPLVVETDVLDATERLEIALTGSATPEVAIEDVYVEPRLKQDVLFVLDDGPQMLPLAASIATELGRYAQSVEVLDTRIGVITTSTAPGEIGRLRLWNGSEWLPRPTPAQLSALGAITGQQTARSSCLEALNAAFADADSGVRRMLRLETPLQVVCVTNRKDELMGPTAPILGDLETRLPRWRELAVVAQFGSTPVCGGTTDDGKLVALANSFYGYMVDVCDWWALRISPVPYDWGFKTNFYLRAEPDVLRAPINVTVDGAERIEGRDWQWDEVRHSVNFDPISAPRFDQVLRIRYLPQCPR